MYDSAVAAFAAGGLRWEGDDVRVMLVTGDYEPDQALHTTVDEVSRFEVEPTGTYVRGGTSVAGRMVARAEFGGEIRLRASSVSWSDLTAEFQYAVLYARDSGQLVAYSDMGAQRVSGAAVTVSYGKDGVAAFMLATPSGV